LKDIRRCMEQLEEYKERFENLKSKFTEHDSCEEVNEDMFERIDNNFISQELLGETLTSLYKINNLYVKDIMKLHLKFYTLEETLGNFALKTHLCKLAKYLEHSNSE